MNLYLIGQKASSAFVIMVSATEKEAVNNCPDYWVGEVDIKLIGKALQKTAGVFVFGQFSQQTNNVF